MATGHPSPGVWLLAFATVLAMVWLAVQNPVAGIIGFLVGKHVLIALLARELGVGSPKAG